MTAWTDHVRNYAAQNGVSYKQAMSEAKHSYNKISGGDFQSMARKTKNTLLNGERKAVNSLNKANKIIERGRVIQRKAKNTTSRIIDEATPLVALASPEIALGMQGMKRAIGGKLGTKNNPYAYKGGSFRTMSEGAGLSKSKNVCRHCGGMSGGSITNTSMINHPSFNAQPRNGFSKSRITN